MQTLYAQISAVLMRCIKETACWTLWLIAFIYAFGLVISFWFEVPEPVTIGSRLNHAWLGGIAFLEYHGIYLVPLSAFFRFVTALVLAARRL